VRAGIGRAIAAKFGGLGWSVAIGGRRVELLAETAPEVERAGGRPFAHAGRHRSRFGRRLLRPGGGAARQGRVAINNAAIGRYGPFDDFSPREIEAEIATKLVGGLHQGRTLGGKKAPRARPLCEKGLIGT
jgi:NAD(P)-dependent dehydrogenase (short-subunit alcohol dehydrogenase family)